MLKRFIRSRLGLFCLSWILAGIITVIMLTVRWRHSDNAHVDAIIANHDGFVLVFWHERILSMPWLWPRHNAMSALQSPHPDGRLLAHTVQHLGVKTVWGSSNRQALSGLRGLKRVLDCGKVAAITPDGPRGPARIAALGPVALANLSQKPIIPIAWSVDRFWRAPGWDGMMIPKPFAKGVLVCGDAIPPAKAASKAALEAQRRAMQDRLNDVTATADARFASQ